MSLAHNAETNPNSGSPDGKFESYCKIRVGFRILSFSLSPSSFLSSLPQQDS